MFYNSSKEGEDLRAGSWERESVVVETPPILSLWFYMGSLGEFRRWRKRNSEIRSRDYSTAVTVVIVLISERFHHENVKARVLGR